MKTLKQLVTANKACFGFPVIFLSFTSPLANAEAIDFTYQPYKKYSTEAEKIDSAGWVLKRIQEIETIDGNQRNNKPLQAIKAGMTAIKSHQEQRDSWQGELSFRYSDENNENASGGDFSFGTTIEITKGGYPTETRIRLNVDIEEDDNGLKENVGYLSLNHDRYLPYYPGLEIFALSKLFTIDQLGVDQRWELGFGLKKEWQIGFTSSGKAINRLFNKQRQKPKALQDDFWKNDKSTVRADSDVRSYPGLLYRDIRGDSATDSIKQKACALFSEKPCSWETASRYHINNAAMLLQNPEFRRGLHRKKAALELSLSTAILKEFLDARVNVIGIDKRLQNEPLIAFNTRTENNTVFSLRPKIVWHISDNVFFEAVHYFKKRLKSSDNNRKSNSDFYDYGESDVSLAYQVTKDFQISLNYIHYIENEPLEITADVVAEDARIQGLLSADPAEPIIFDSGLFKRSSAESYERFAVQVKVQL